MNTGAAAYEASAQNMNPSADKGVFSPSAQARLTRTSFGFSLGKFGLSYESLRPVEADGALGVGRIEKADGISQFAAELEAAMQLDQSPSYKTNYDTAALSAYGVRAYETVAAMAYEDIPRAVGGTIGYV
jgi:hypothetical protein